MTQIRIPHVNIAGLDYIDCSFTQPADQEYCPLEHTEYESLCVNPIHNVQLRASGPCEHSAECFNLRAQLNSQRLDR
jgi:hypothetical protein